MQFPSQVGVVILPNAVLFPHAYLPIYIFEARYRRLLAEALASQRMVGVAIRQSGRRMLPANVAGLGLIRAAVDQPDGSSHVILQGLARIELGERVRCRPYHVYGYRLLDSQARDAVMIDRLTGKILELVSSQLQPSQTIHLSFDHATQAISPTGETSSQPGVELMADVDSPEQIADLISWTLVSDPSKRQTLLETLDVETRLRRLIQFLLAEVQDSSQRSPNSP